jgi:aspartyl-tRNA(Asn)/glutamyl-tRNA(Gln) amidotransferase subunit A
MPLPPARAAAAGLLIHSAGLPVVAVPIPRPGALPVGVQVLAAPWNEAAALRVAAALEAAGIAAAPVAA